MAYDSLPQVRRFDCLLPLASVYHRPRPSSLCLWLVFSSLATLAASIHSGYGGCRGASELVMSWEACSAGWPGRTSGSRGFPARPSRAR